MVVMCGLFSFLVGWWQGWGHHSWHPTTNPGAMSRRGVGVEGDGGHRPTRCRADRASLLARGGAAAVEAAGSGETAVILVAHDQVGEAFGCTGGADGWRGLSRKAAPESQGRFPSPHRGRP